MPIPELTLRKRALKQENLYGFFLNLGSTITAEIAALSGIDWLLLDLEHGMGDWDTLVHQLQSIEGTAAAPLVRIPNLDVVYFKRALDMGAQGIMVPYIETAGQAAEAVKFARYPPHGMRGVSYLNRGAGYGRYFQERLEHAHETTLVIIQIETARAVENIDEIAAVDGVDVLFVGPFDLSVNLGMARQFDRPEFIAATEKVAAAAHAAKKVAGILLPSVEGLPSAQTRGFTFISIGSDGGFVKNGADAALARARELSKK